MRAFSHNKSAPCLKQGNGISVYELRLFGINFYVDASGVGYVTYTTREIPGKKNTPAFDLNDSGVMTLSTKLARFQ